VELSPLYHVASQAVTLHACRGAHVEHKLVDERINLLNEEGVNYFGPWWFTSSGKQARCRGGTECACGTVAQVHGGGIG
jgi:hypothetical protein